MADTSHSPPSRDVLNQQVKSLLRRDLKLGPDAEIADDMPLIGGEFELDSLDVVLLIGSVEKQFGIKLPRDATASQVFGSVDAIVRFLQDHPELLNGKAANASAPGGASQNGNGAAHSAGGNTGGNAGGGDTAGGGLDAVLAGLPHAQPFRFVTALTQLKPGVSATGRWKITGAEDFFRGHFPGRPVVPGVLMGEALAQVAGFIAPAPGSSPGSDLATAAEGVSLAQINVKFRRPVQPPATLVLHAQHDQTRQGLMHCRVRATVADALVADGELTLKLPG